MPRTGQSQFAPVQAGLESGRTRRD